RRHARVSEAARQLDNASIGVPATDAFAGCASGARQKLAHEKRSEIRADQQHCTRPTLCFARMCIRRIKGEVIMRSLFRVTTLPFAVIGILTGCSLSTVDPQDALGDEFATENALTNPEAYTFFEVTKDLRKCAFPSCGGWFISRLNSGTTRCHNGQNATSCYTPVLDWSTAGLIEAQQAVLLAAAEDGAVSDGVKGILRGRFARTNSTPRPDLGRFV